MDKSKKIHKKMAIEAMIRQVKLQTLIDEILEEWLEDCGIGQYLPELREKYRKEIITRKRQGDKK